ncbi:MAG: DNA-packaging protein [Proteobacteria bacterium]|nr:DNA-packaging protein [Pseudomonadota bacterium]
MPRFAPPRPPAPERNPVAPYDASFWQNLTPEELDAALETLNDQEAEFVCADWLLNARPEQLAPQGDWRIWLFLGGRGAGKTRSGAEWIAEGVANGAMRRIGLLGATYDDARAVMIEGESGLLGVSEGADFEPSLRRVRWPNGAIARVLSADEPDSIRGHQFDTIWADEFAKWPDPQGALDMALMALRLGTDPRMAITTTPRAIEALLELVTSPDVAVTKSATAANAAHLAPGFLETMQRRYGGSRLGRQELDAELIEDNDAALWRRAWIEDTRVKSAPPLARIVIAVDPPVSADGDECGIVVAGRVADDGDGYVLADMSLGGLTPQRWAERVADAYEAHKADSVVAEANQGGEMVKHVLQQAHAHLPVRLVHATRDKRTRATPIAALYEAGRVHHIGVLPELEDQLCQFDGTGSSPDRLDALVWALSELFPPVRPANPKIRSV